MTWHRDKDRCDHIKSVDGVAYRWFEKPLAEKYFSSPSVAVDARAFRSAMRVAHEFVLVNTIDGNEYHFDRKRKEEWSHPWSTAIGERIVVRLSKADSVRSWREGSNSFEVPGQ